MTWPCVVPTIYGPKCTDARCVWESQAADQTMNEASRSWASMVAELCRTVPAGPRRDLVTELALNWDGNAAELLAVVDSVLTEPEL